MNKRTAISFILAVLGVCGLELLFLICERAFIGGIIFLPVVYVTYITYRYLLNEKRNLRSCVLAVILSFIYASFFVFGMQFDILSNVSFFVLTFFCVSLMVIEFFPFVQLLLVWLENCRVEQKENAVLLKRCFVLLLIVWCVSYLALFPGVYGLDAPYWYYEFSRQEIPISSQWSPIYCGLFYSFIRFGEIFLHSRVIGFALFTAFQMVITLYAIWRILSFAVQKLNEKFVIGITIFFMVPIHVILALTSAQDAMFSVCFGMAVLYLSEYALDEEKFWANKKNVVELIVWLFLMCVIRNNGLYALFVMMVLLLFIKKARKLLFSLMTVIFLVLFYQGPVYNMMDIEKGTAIREMLSLPLQQMAYVYNHSDQLTDEKKREMQVYISDDGWKSYEPCISDHVKGQLDVEAVKNKKSDFLKLYLECFSVDPIGYLQAAGLQTFGLWYPDKVWPDQRPWHPYIDLLCYDTAGWYDMDFSIYRKSLCPPYELVLKLLFGYGVSGDGYGGNLKMLFPRIPILNELCQIGTYTWILIFELFYAIYKRNKGILIILSLEFGLWLTVLLSPVVMYRYCAPFVFTAPLYISVLFLLKNKREDEKKVLECKRLGN